jgi:ABC-type oligopeptide transport system substrate-binding subunit
MQARSPWQDHHGYDQWFQCCIKRFQAGEVDVIGVNGDQAVALKAEKFPVYTYDDGSTLLRVQYIRSMLANQNLRTALTYAVDKQLSLMQS